MNPTKRNYRATFIIDNRGKEESVEQIIEGVKQVITTVQGDVSAVENLGRRDFVRVTDPKLTGATYVHISFSAPAEGPGQLKERLRLNHNVYRTFVESV
ncbi:MAG: 30S ribosomal protein S6 [Verrucomicrobiales bacterium VVV1]|nr:MAG: 30S ribosomal protein S6 [Verrucomicrobiales bacterium VVV1]